VRLVSAAAVTAAVLGAGCSAGTDEAAPRPSGGGVGVEEASRQPPPPVTRLSVSRVASGVELRWPASPDVRYRIERRTGPGAVVVAGTRTVDAPGEAVYLDAQARAAGTLEYRLVPENVWGLEGEPSRWEAVADAG
jgi:hypothetical protein